MQCQTPAIVYVLSGVKARRNNLRCLSTNHQLGAVVPSSSDTDKTPSTQQPHLTSPLVILATNNYLIQLSTNPIDRRNANPSFTSCSSPPRIPSLSLSLSFVTQPPQPHNPRSPSPHPSTTYLSICRLRTRPSCNEKQSPGLTGAPKGNNPRGHRMRTGSSYLPTYFTYLPYTGASPHHHVTTSRHVTRRHHPTRSLLPARSKPNPRQPSYVHEQHSPLLHASLEVPTYLCSTRGTPSERSLQHRVDRYLPPARPLPASGGHWIGGSNPKHFRDVMSCHIT
ncbi:hypothetical protein F4780DRAFT_617008 [Xylariomycetidae sp. FL0641]|nr:hypothetical protein F4780DRAFT_617008 [Xylariomycetidae sp. FL0641]